MAYSSVSTLPLSHNDVANLAHILKVPLNYYFEKQSPLYQDFVKKLSTIAGLGFVPVMVEGGAVSTYQRHLETFLHYRDFQEHPESIHTLSIAVAEMISWGAFVYSLLDYPEYYKHFAQAVKKLLVNSILGLYGHVEEVYKREGERITNLILSGPSLTK